jgi:hypothetical protein
MRWLAGMVVGLAALAASLFGMFGPGMQLGVERHYYVCAGRMHTNVYPDPEAVAIEGATLSLRFYHFPVILWADDVGDATFITSQSSNYYDHIDKLGDLAKISSAHSIDMLGMLNSISGSLQISEYSRHYDLQCKRAHP